MTNTYTIKCKSFTNDYPGAQATYSVRGKNNGQFFRLEVKWFANEGFDVPTVTRRVIGKDYFEEMKPLVRLMSKGKLSLFQDLQEGEIKTVVIDTDNKETYWQE